MSENSSQNPPPGDESRPDEIIVPVEAEVNPNEPLQRRKLPFWKRFGGEGFTISLAIHGVLVILALFWVVSTMTESAKTKKDPTTFATGAGGGSNGDKAKNYEHKIKPKNAKALAKNAARITSKSTTATIALPDMPVSTSSSMLNALTSGGASKGFGGGSGGGIGSGIGAGVGGGKNFVGLKVMGARIFANRIAVYMDSSKSLQSYLDRVRGEITKQFPDADIFMYGGTKITVVNGKIIGMEKSQLKDIKPSIEAYQRTSEASLPTSNGKDLFKKYDEAFTKVGLGAFIEAIRNDPRARVYNAIVIFSDFNDGVVQTRTQGKGEQPMELYADGIGRDKDAPDFRTADEKRWMSFWVDHFKRGGATPPSGPKLYLFSTDQVPPPVLIDCVKASKGKLTMVKWLLTGGNPPENPEDEEY